MIARTWHGRTKTADAEAYRKYVEETGIQQLTTTSGNLGAQIWQQSENGITHIWVVSWWKDYESIKAFAGEETERARYFEEDKKYLMEFEPHVKHYEAYKFRPMV